MESPVPRRLLARFTDLLLRCSAPAGKTCGALRPLRSRRCGRVRIRLLGRLRSALRHHPLRSRRLPIKMAVRPVRPCSEWAPVHRRRAALDAGLGAGRGAGRGAGGRWVGLAEHGVSGVDHSVPVDPGGFLGGFLAREAGPEFGRKLLEPPGIAGWADQALAASPDRAPNVAGHGPPFSFLSFAGRSSSLPPRRPRPREMYPPYPPHLPHLLHHHHHRSLTEIRSEGRGGVARFSRPPQPHPVG